MGIKVTDIAFVGFRAPDLDQMRSYMEDFGATHVSVAPSIPGGPRSWGQALIARGDAAHAVAQCREALRRSPRAEEALEGLGEALALQGDASAATTQYAAADKLTPNWGRLHLKWGEALAKLGKSDEARAQLKTAADLDLTPAERAELGSRTR